MIGCVLAVGLRFSMNWFGGGEEVFVSPKGSETGDGSYRNPVATLEQARDKVRGLKKDKTVTVYLLPGNYPRTDSFTLSAQDGGTDEAPVIYRAYKPGTVLIHGAKKIDPAAFKPAARADLPKGVLVADLSDVITGKIKNPPKSYRGVAPGPFLYCNGQAMTLARWPNAADGMTYFTNSVVKGDGHTPGSFVYDRDDRPKKWKADSGVWFLGYWTHNWYEEVIQMASYDPATKIISLAAGHSYGIGGATWGASQKRFYALNLLEELDVPGEWYLDRTEKKLYFYPPAEMKSVYLADLEKPLLDAKAVTNVCFENLAFGYVQSDALSLKDTERLFIFGCTIANVARGGIVINGNRNCVRSCDLFNIGATGISLFGGDRKQLVKSENLVENCRISRFGQFSRTYNPAIMLQGCGNYARRNNLSDAPHMAVGYGGNEQTIELNDVGYVVLETSDASAFYTGRDWTSQGNTVRWNYIHNLGPEGKGGNEHAVAVYLDDCDSGDTVDGNILYKTGRAMLIGGGRDNTIVNNIMIDSIIGIHFDSRGMTWKQWNIPGEGWNLEEKAERMNYKNPPWSVAYPRLARTMDEEPRKPLGNVFRNNTFVNTEKKAWSLDKNSKEILPQLNPTNNLELTTEEAYARTDFDPKDPASFIPLGKDALLKLQPSLQKIPVKLIGTFKDKYRKDDGLPSAKIFD